MERCEYHKLDRLENRMWWFAASQRNLLMLSRRQMLAEFAGQPILDAGCGTGGFLVKLANCYPKRVVFGLDADSLACQRATAKSLRPICVGSINTLPFLERTFAAIFSVDVLCHRAVDERCAFRQFYRCLADNGWLFVNVPAYTWMSSSHDAAVHNARRYTARSLSQLLEAAGFSMVYITYWNTLLFPLMVISRKVLFRRSKTSDVMEYPRAIDSFCRLATSFETTLLRNGVKLPFGSSVIAIATKRSSDRE